MKNKSKNIRSGKIDLDEIAKQDGFPELFAHLSGYRNYVAYTDGKIVRIYDPRTGKKVRDYKSRSLDVSPRFHSPVQVTPYNLPVMITGYSRGSKRRYDKN